MEEEKKVENKNKSTIGLVVIIVVLIIISLSLGAFVFINRDKLMDNKEKTTGTTKVTEKNIAPKKVTTYSVEDEKITKLIENLTAGIGCDEIEEFVKDKKFESNDVSDIRAFKIVAYRKDTKLGSTVEEVTKQIQKYLGSNYKFDPNNLNDLKGSCTPYYYDKATNTFIVQETICGSECGPGTSYKIVKAVDTDGLLEMDVKMVFTDAKITGYYSDYNRTKKIGNIEDDLDSLYKEGSTYKFIFKEENGNYVFVSSEPVNE